MIASSDLGEQGGAIVKRDDYIRQRMVYTFRRRTGRDFKVLRRDPLWFPKSMGAGKLKRVLYRMRYPIGQTISIHNLD